MPVKITILDRATNTTNEYICELSDEETLNESFWWNEGNMACDCNRSSAFSGYKWSTECWDETFKGERFEVVGWEKLDGSA